MAWTPEQKDISRKSFQQWKAKNKAELNYRPGRHHYFRGKRRHEERDWVKTAVISKRS
ncbi:hypothetical protein [Paenibacillus sp. USDA918EY]|uniref:hypothetical protein n=1 Tax=Paenibacillus sp. USDA918EY TaxID=2689575 RepID=UPI00135C0EB0|nr:hypothetical protein [Paenibacillus sp. USDA918EY]